MELIRRPEHRIPAAVEQSWERIEAWLAVHLPDALGTLRPPAADADLDRLESRIGRPLPPDFRASYRIHDGQDWSDDTAEMGILFGMHLRPLVENEGIAWLYEHRVDPSWPDPEEFEWLMKDWTFFPPGAIRRAKNGPGWVPFFWDSGRNFVGIDLAPGPNGVVGQVIPFGLEDLYRPVLALSFAQLLEDIADELEAGRGEVGTFDEGVLALRLRGAYLGYFANAYKDWAEAKLPASFQSQSDREHPEPA